MQKKLIKSINQKVLKTKIGLKKHIYSPNINTTNIIKTIATQITRKNILIKNEEKKIGAHRQYEIQKNMSKHLKKNSRIEESKKKQKESQKDKRRK